LAILTFLEAKNSNPSLQKNGKTCQKLISDSPLAININKREYSLILQIIEAMMHLA
jgi:hypothetical protein